MKHSFFLIQLILAQAALAQTAPPANKASMLSDGAQSRKLRAPIGMQDAATSATTKSLGTGGFIEAVLDNNGKFTIGTLAGDPSKTSDDNKVLLYGHPNPGTSDTMIKVDGVASSIHSGLSSGVTASSDSLSVTLTVGSIQVLERLSIKTSQATGNKDAVEIYFKVTNAGAGSHAVSLRTQLDTQLGDNDGAPFRIPHVGEATKDLEFDNDPATLSIGDIPAQALVMDNLTSPNIIALLTFTDLGYIKPDRVVFGYWPASVGVWDYTVDPSRSFLDNNGDGVISGYSPDSDSSVIVWWGYPAANAFTLPSGGSKEFAIQYGIGNCSSLSASPLTVLFCAPAVLQGNVLGAGFAYSPVNLTAFISNNSNAAVSKGVATLNFTPDLQLASGYTKARPIEGTSGSGVLAAGKNTQIDWQILSKGRHLDARPISLSIDAAGKHSSSVRNVTVQTIAGLLYGQATDESGAPVAGASITVMRGGAVVASATTQSDGTYSVQGLSPGPYDLRMSAAGRPDVYFSAAVANTTASSSVSGNPSSFGAGTNLQSFAYPNPARSGKAHISFFTSGAASCDIELFTASGELIRKIPYTAAGAGWHSADWDIDGVANGVYLYRVTAGGSHSGGRIAVLKRRGI